MQSRFAVSHIDWANNDLTTLIVYAPDWRAALMQHPKIKEAFALTEEEAVQRSVYHMPIVQEEAKQMAFDTDMMINAVEIPHDGPY